MKLFVLGFTMGSTDRVLATEEVLYTFFARYLYPKSYRFSDKEVASFRDAVRLGYISDCVSLSKVDFASIRHRTLTQAREHLDIEAPLLRAYFEIEHRRYPEAIANARLLA